MGRFLASLRRHSYLAVLGGLTSCGPKPAPVAPSTGFTASTLRAFSEAAAPTAPTRYEIVRISWRTDDGNLQLSGGGAVRLAPPDSLRADIAASLGLGRSTVIMTGERVVAQPAAVVDQVLPDRFALWAVLGVIRVPPGVVSVERLEEGTRSVWRVTDSGGRMTIFELSSGALSMVSRAEGDQTISQMRLSRDAAGAVRQASLTDFRRRLRLEVEINGREASEPFAADVWQLRP